MKIIGITGKAGAGKGEAAEYLKKKGFKHYSVREFLMVEVKRRQLPDSRDSTLFVANFLRENVSPFYLAEQAYKEAVKNGQDAIIESIRSTAEGEFIKSLPNSTLLGITANDQVRFARLKARGGKLDNVTFEEFMRQDKAEDTSTNPAHSNISACLKLADVVITNEGSTSELFATLDEFVAKLK